MDILIDLVVAPLVAFAAGRLYQRWRDRRPFTFFWRLNQAQGLMCAVSLRSPDPTEHTYYVPSGDAKALAELARAYGPHYPKLEMRLYREADAPMQFFTEPTLLIGGGKNNITTRCLLAALDPPLCSRDHLYPTYDFKGLTNRAGEVLLQSRVDRATLERDYCYIIRTRDPLCKTDVYIVVGGFSVGTYAGARWLTSKRNLHWLRRRYIFKAVSSLVLRSEPWIALKLFWKWTYRREGLPKYSLSVGCQGFRTSRPIAEGFTFSTRLPITVRSTENGLNKSVVTEPSSVCLAAQVPGVGRHPTSALP